MHTYLFSNDDIRCYVRDLADRLDNLGENFPTVWYTLGESGDKIAEVLYPLIKSDSHRNKINVQPIYFNRTHKTVLLRDGTELKSYSATTPALLLDGAVHSGNSMGESVKKITTSGANEVLSYSFVVKRTSTFIPNYFGILVGEHDRPYFQLDVIPNNILREDAPFGTLRRICSDDVKRDQRFLNTEVASMALFASYVGV